MLLVVLAIGCFSGFRAGRSAEIVDGIDGVVSVDEICSFGCRLCYKLPFAVVVLSSLSFVIMLTVVNESMCCCCCCCPLSL